MSMKAIQTQVEAPGVAGDYQRQSQPPSSPNLRFCPNCGKKFSNFGFSDHLFSSKDCMRRFWDEEEKDGAVRRRLRLQQARKAAAAVAVPQ
jgi:hypothetical protein